MPRASVPTGIELEYDTTGSPDDPALLLIMGFTAQMTAWPDDFCKMLADTGLFVIRFDNRDCGLSTKFDGVDVDIVTILGGGDAADRGRGAVHAVATWPPTPSGLLDHLGIERAHIIGASMGGMIAQTIAIEHPQRVPQPDLGDEHDRRSERRPSRTRGDRPRCSRRHPTDREAYIESAPQLA